MPVCYLHVRIDTHSMVTEEMELGHSQAARQEAAKRIGALLHDHSEQVWADEEWQMDVTDADGLILYVIQLSARKSSATQGVGSDGTP